MEVVFNRDKLSLDTNRKIYTCNVCQKLFNWGENSWWFGTLKQADDDPSKLTYCCSDKCKEKHEKNSIKK